MLPRYRGTFLSVNMLALFLPRELTIYSRRLTLVHWRGIFSFPSLPFNVGAWLEKVDFNLVSMILHAARELV